MRRKTAKCPIVFSLILLLIGCNERFGTSLFDSPHPHQRYLSQLERADLAQSRLYQGWKRAAVSSLEHPVTINIPHQEELFFHPADPRAIAYLFVARKGELLSILLDLKGLDSAEVFADLFSYEGDSLAATEPSHIASGMMDQRQVGLDYQVRKDGQYMLRIQPELLAEVTVRMNVTAEPSLADLVDPEASQYIGSVFGDPRDGGARRHEGIDIFAARSTPVLAAIDGMIGRVGNNRLGGKVVWLRPQHGDYHRRLNLYYAHLDSQLVTPGQMVQVGDTIGLLGNTGNAQTTPPHLHFGIYSADGAVDPLPFVKPNKSDPPQIRVDTAMIGDTLRSLRDRIPVRVISASKQYYRVLMPNGKLQQLPPQQLTNLIPIRTDRLVRPMAVFAQPDTTSARMTVLPEGATVKLIGEFDGFYLIDENQKGWIKF